MIGARSMYLVLLLAVVGLVASTPVVPGPRADCPTTYGDILPTLIVSLDGFRADYRDRGLTPTISAMAAAGVTAPYMKPSYPTVTFPNHYTMVTGSYPEHHGIIANKFYDPEFQATFSIGSAESLEGRWWGAEPIWNTLTNQGKFSATYFWPGSEADIGGLHPTYWVPYNESIPFEDRVDQVLEWIMLPVETRPSWISLYFFEPDHSGHDFGPDSQEVDDLLVVVDLMLTRLLDGLEVAGIISCVNIIVVADHGMATGGANKVILLADYIPDIYDTAYTYTGAFARIDPKNESEAVKVGMMEQLACQNEALRVYERAGLPTRFHFANNRRIEDIVLDLDPGYAASVSSTWYLMGQHGYDNYSPFMNALFLAVGPAFQQGLEIEPFQNIELYNLVCLLTGVTPAPNNGTEGALYHVLVNPPESPILPQETAPPTSSFPAGDLDPLLSLSGCSGDLAVPEEWLQALALTPDEETTLQALHLPWGIPQSGSLPADLTLLHHKDHVTAYSQALHMPLWTSFSLNSVSFGTVPALWSSDVRLTAETTSTCAEYENLLPSNITMGPLFPPEMSVNVSLERIPYMVSNAVPVSNQLNDRWRELVGGLIPGWIVSQGPLNVIMGPLFDNDANSHVDDFTQFGIPEVPSDLFAIVTRCQEFVSSIELCPAGSLDALTFIYPQTQPVSNCRNQYDYALEFSAKVRDVELATGLTFYSDLAFEDRSRVTLRINSQLWPNFKDGSLMG